MYRILEELRRIEKRDGMIRPVVVVEEAKDVNSPLHTCFAWNDTEAAESYRIWQARVLISSVEVEIRGNKTQAFRNVRVVVDKVKTQGYFSTSRVLQDKSMSNAVLRDALREIDHWQKKYEALQILSGVINESKIKELAEVVDGA